MAADRPRQVKAWKEQVLAHYLEDHQLEVWDEAGDNVFFIPNQVLVAERVLPDVERRLERYGGRRTAGTVRLRRLGLAPSGPRERGGSPGPARPGAPVAFDLDPTRRVNAAELALELADQHGGAVAPNHLVTGLQRRMGWPDGDPEPAPDPLPGMAAPVPGQGAGVSVAIIDTGWPSELPPGLDWFRDGVDHHTADGELDEEGAPLQHLDQLDTDRDGYLDVEAGHGFFVAGIIRRMAPSARLVFLKALNSDGVGTELGVANAIRYATARGVDLVNLSLGFYSLRDAGSSSVEDAVAGARQAGQTLVAAAGNDGLRSPAYPAAFPGVIGVGALAEGGREIASFSNRGDWVDVHAPGERVQSTFVRGREHPTATKDRDPDRFRSDTAVWSGTSFACAYVSGYLAAGLTPAGGKAAYGGGAAERVASLLDALDPMPGRSRRLDPQLAF
jgi:hypothetical protein